MHAPNGISIRFPEQDYEMISNAQDSDRKGPSSYENAKRGACSYENARGSPRLIAENKYRNKKELKQSEKQSLRPIRNSGRNIKSGESDYELKESETADQSLTPEERITELEGQVLEQVLEAVKLGALGPEGSAEDPAIMQLLLLLG